MSNILPLNDAELTLDIAALERVIATLRPGDASGPKAWTSREEVRSMRVVKMSKKTSESGYEALCGDEILALEATVGGSGF